MAAAMRAYDWAATPLGPPEFWPQALKIALRLMLSARFEMWLGWGPDLRFFYNDAYIPTLGLKHPDALGQPMRDVWSEIYPTLAPRVRTVLEDGVATWDSALMLLLARNGPPEETYHTFSYNPLRGDTGAVEGLICFVTEDTARVISERRLATLRTLATSLLEARNRRDILRVAAAALDGNEHDFPFSVLQFFERPGGKAGAASKTPSLLDVDWLRGRSVDGEDSVVISLEGMVSDPPSGAWDTPPRDALIVPIASGEQDASSGVLVLGLNPYRPYDQGTLDFGRLLAGQIAGALAFADARQAELAEAERLRTLFDQSHSFIAILRGPEHRFEQANPAYSRLSGHRELVGKTVREAFPELSGQGYFELLDKVYTTGEPYIGRSEPFYVLGATTGQRELLFLDLVYQPIRNREGAITGVFVDGVDVTSTQKALLALRESETRFRTLAQALPDIVWIASPEGEVEWFNDRAAAYSGMPAAALEGYGWVTAVHPDDVELAVSSWAKAVESGQGYHVEFRLRRADGMFRWHLNRSIPTHDPSGQLIRWIGVNTDIHERRLSEAQNVRDRDTIWALSQEFMMVSDFDGVISGVNPSAARLLGWPEEEMVGRKFSDYLHPADLSATRREIERLSHGGTTSGFRNRYRTRDGDYRLIDWMGVSDGERIHAVGRDITEEHALARDRERIWSLSPVIKIVGTMAGTIEAVNPAWTQSLGWTEHETIGRNIMEFVAPENIEVGAAGMRALEVTASITDYEIDFVTRDGSRRRIAWSTVLEDERLFGFGRDITTETEASAALEHSTAERERIWNSTNDLMGKVGIDGFLKTINPGWMRLLGYSEQELLATPFLELIEKADHPKTATVVADLAAGIAPKGFECRFIRKDGSPILLSWSAEPEGAFFYVVGRNITDQRATEEALRQSQKMEAVGQLTGGIAHDFNNLLQGIIGSLDLLDRRVAQGRTREVKPFVDAAMSSAQRASALIHRLLAFARRQPLDPRPVRVNPLISSMEDLLRRTLGEQIDLQFALADDLVQTLCDPNQLESAILNLVINSRDAMPDGGKLVIETDNAELDAAYAATRSDVRPGQYVCISVTDTGIGMSADTISKAFEPFFTTKPLGQGTGLGLSMIYGFARQSEGHVKIYSQLGVGTTCKLYLPRYRGEAEPEHEIAQPPTATSARAGERVLVVEDEPVVRELIIQVLSELGYDVVQADNGADGLNILRAPGRIDLLITDIGLPVLNGRQLADAGRAFRPGLKILFMTGYAENAALAAGFLERGMSVITKPFAIDALAARIRQMIELP